jgi:hypothetical protein
MGEHRERDLADLRTIALIQDQLCWLAGSSAVRNAEITTVVKILMRWQDRLKGERPALPIPPAPEDPEGPEDH